MVEEVMMIEVITGVEVEDIAVAVATIVGVVVATVVGVVLVVEVDTIEEGVEVISGEVTDIVAVIDIVEETDMEVVGTGLIVVIVITVEIISVEVIDMEVVVTDMEEVVIDTVINFKAEIDMEIETGLVVVVIEIDIAEVVIGMVVVTGMVVVVVEEIEIQDHSESEGVMIMTDSRELAMEAAEEETVTRNSINMDHPLHSIKYIKQRYKFYDTMAVKILESTHRRITEWIFLSHDRQ